MQRFSVPDDPEERRVVRRWRVRVLAFYGSVVSGLLLLSVLADQPTQIAGNTDRPPTRITASR
jgi:hypothetical protein